MEIATRFLQTAVIVDDEAQIGALPPPDKLLVTPGRRTSARTAEEVVKSGTPNLHRLDARILVDSFANLGLICAVIAPRRNDEALIDNVVLTAKRADLVVLDWQLSGDNGKETLSMLKEILKDDADERLRLIAVYTGEQDIDGIGKTIAQELEQMGCKFRRDDLGVVLSYRYCRIVIYAKSDTPLAQELKDRSIPEADVPKYLIRDFANMAEGLLPSIALTSLAAVRENVHKILDRFHATLDPAFLTHRACLPVPEDSQQHMVDQLASELHAIMEDAAARENPAGIEVVKKWLAATHGPNDNFNFGENKTLSFDQTVALLREGLGQEPGALSKSKDFKILTSGFAKSEDMQKKLDCELAWMFNFRTVFDASRRILYLGTVLRKQNDTDDSGFFLCMRPRCDSVWLSGENSFLLLPLIEPRRKLIQLVLRTDKDTYRRVSVGTNASQWLLVRFSPRRDGEPIIAEQDKTGDFFFTDSDGTQFEWLGELKAEFAQRIAHHFASGLSRVAINNSEWLRRLEKL